MPVNLYKSSQVSETVEKIYTELLERKVEVLLDDRSERIGVMFADMELIGIPKMIIVGERNLDSGMVEYKDRRTNETKLVKLEDIYNAI